MVPGDHLSQAAPRWASTSSRFAETKLSRSVPNTDPLFLKMKTMTIRPYLNISYNHWTLIESYVNLYIRIFILRLRMWSSHGAKKKAIFVNFFVSMLWKIWIWKLLGLTNKFKKCKKKFVHLIFSIFMNENFMVLNATPYIRMRHMISRQRFIWNKKIKVFSI